MEHREESDNSCLGMFMSALAYFVWLTFALITVVVYILMSPLLLVAWIISKFTGEDF
jgi:uncharacterized membrane protein